MKVGKDLDDETIALQLMESAGQRCKFQYLFLGGGDGRVGGLRMCHPPYHPS